MKNWLSIIGVVAIASCAFASQSPPNQKRIDAIWGAAADRMSQQTDIWFRDGDFPRVIQLLKMQADIFPGDYEVSSNLGWLLESIEKTDEALAEYIRYKKDNPQDPNGPFQEANFYFRKKAYDKVPLLIEPTLKTKPQANSYRILAHSYEKMNLLQDSERVWKMYIQLAPDDGAAKNNLSRVEKKIHGGAKLHRKPR